MNPRGKEFRKLLDKYYNIGEHFTFATRTFRCHGCGEIIYKGTYYINIFIYMSLWYKFHISSKCRLRALVAIESLYEPHDVKDIDDAEILQRIRHMRETNYLFLYNFSNKNEIDWFVKSQEKT